MENDKVMFRLITNFHPLFLCLQNQFLNLILISLRDNYVTLKVKEKGSGLMSTIDYMGIIENYIPPGLKAYQIETGRVGLTDYLDALQGQIAEEVKEMGIQKNDLIESMKKQLNVRITKENSNSEYLDTLRAIADLVIDRIEQHF